MSEPGQYPLLVFGDPSQASRQTLLPNRGGARLRRRSAAEQAGRLGGKWQALLDALEARRATLTSDLGSADPELVVVFEAAGSIGEFQRAASRIPGFEYLAEIDEEVDNDGFLEETDDVTEATVGGSFYLVATNRQALDAVLGLWQSYQQDESIKFPRGLAPWKNLFGYLSDVRRWSAADRLRGTGLQEDVAERSRVQDPAIPLEIELWYRDATEDRLQAELIVRRLVLDAGGEVYSQATVNEIAYHALLVSVPRLALEPIVDGRFDGLPLVQAQEIAFLRPESQAVVSLPEVDEEPASGGGPSASVSESTGPPLVAMLDGLPVANHQWLSGRVEVDDPDGWGADIPVGSRNHGTAMASLILHGDLSAPDAPLERGLYARPVLVPASNSKGSPECVPHNRLAIDLVHECVVRMLDPSTPGGARSPDVKLINLSLGDVSRQLISTLSPWARLLDFLSYEYGVLFVVSAGNHTAAIQVDVEPKMAPTLATDDLRASVVDTLVRDAANRRLLSPAESINALTVGAVHADAAGALPKDPRIDLLAGSALPGPLPSPLSAAGMGYRRMIKPDLVAPGGRLLFRRRPFSSSDVVTMYDPVVTAMKPGIGAAAPGGTPANLGTTRFMHGTSCAAALVSHHGGRLLESLAALGEQVSDAPGEEYWAVITKALLVHTASIPQAAAEIADGFDLTDTNARRNAVSRFYGYGLVRPELAMAGSSQRATAVGWGTLRTDRAEVYEFPLPPSLDGRSGSRRLTLTLAYFSPVEVHDRRHRSVHMYFLPDQQTLGVRRAESQWQSVRRGTVQHEILDGTTATSVVDGDSLRVQVNCRAVGNRVLTDVPYALAVTLEAEADIPLYAEVASRLRAQVRARV